MKYNHMLQTMNFKFSSNINNKPPSATPDSAASPNYNLNKEPQFTDEEILEKAS